MNPLFHTGFSISDSLKSVLKSVLIYETIIAVAVAVVMELALVALDRQIIQQLCFRLDTPNFTWTL